MSSKVYVSAKTTAKIDISEYIKENSNLSQEELEEYASELIATALPVLNYSKADAEVDNFNDNYSSTQLKNIISGVEKPVILVRLGIGLIYRVDSDVNFDFALKRTKLISEYDNITFEKLSDFLIKDSK